MRDFFTDPRFLDLCYAAIYQRVMYSDRQIRELLSNKCQRGRKGSHLSNFLRHQRVPELIE
ncbi:hypothetical protein D3C84_892830 [compost metagenome]